MNLTRIVSLVIVACLCLGPVAYGADQAAGANPAAVKKTIQICAVCHGAHGQSISPTFPNLAAQRAPYIEEQLKSFKDQTRGDPDAQAYMWGMASQLSDGMITQLADYFAAQPPPPGHAGPRALVAEGKKLFTQGLPARGIPPCASCHGADAAGRAAFPRLAGQHAPYLLKQLISIQNVLRLAPVMHGVIKDMTREQMQAVVVYLESI